MEVKESQADKRLELKSSRCWVGILSRQEVNAAGLTRVSVEIFPQVHRFQVDCCLILGKDRG